MTTTHYTTFWSFLTKEKIEIPIIQRDYAQGRSGQEKLREKFLTDLKKELDKEEFNYKLKLDFVYGSIENEKLQPLDGQQRLTTLWLLHWYIAYKAGKLSENTEIFKHFTYETRISSREFCNKLSEFSEGTNNSIISHVHNQTWFYTAWKQDPSIQAMLNMLGGTDLKEEDANLIDGIEELFKNTSKTEFEDYWGKLTGEDCPIIFYYMPLSELKLSDDLYIKMNARGKPLTSFENFKADLVGSLKDIELDKDKELQNTIAHKLDNEWTDIFWKNKSENNKIDEIYFVFLNRYFLNNLITAKKSDDTYSYKQSEIESNRLFKYLYGASGNDTSIKYSSFDIYKSENENIINKNLFNGLINSLDNFNAAFKSFSKDDLNSLFSPEWNKKTDFRFIPEYDKDIPTTLTQPHRVVFYAIFSYFENCKYNETAFKQWMRIVWNIVANANIETISAMIGVMRLIDEIKLGANNIYIYLANLSDDIKSQAAKGQVAEEIEKAKQIVNDTSNKWECKIIEAEKSAFFKGAIRFLFRTGDNDYNWDIFDKRFEKAKDYFNSNGVVEKDESILLRFLISGFDKLDYFHPGDKFKISFYYDNDISNWMTVLTHIAFIIPVNKIFEHDINEFNFQNFESPMSNKLKSFHEDIVKTSILAKIVSMCTFHWWNYGGYYSLYPYNTKSQKKIYVLADKRNEILSRLEKDKVIKVDDWQRIEGIPFFKGWELHFTLMSNGRKYQWWNCLKELNDNVWKEIPNVDLDNLGTYLEEIKL
jgi:hypothetical protein